MRAAARREAEQRVAAARAQAPRTRPPRSRRRYAQQAQSDRRRGAAQRPASELDAARAGERRSVRAASRDFMLDRVVPEAARERRTALPRDRDVEPGRLVDRVHRACSSCMWFRWLLAGVSRRAGAQQRQIAEAERHRDEVKAALEALRRRSRRARHDAELIVQRASEQRRARAASAAARGDATPASAPCATPASELDRARAAARRGCATSLLDARCARARATRRGASAPRPTRVSIDALRQLAGAAAPRG